MDTITFIDDRYYTSPSGKHWPRVTTILEAFPKGEALYSWMKSQGRNADDLLKTAGEIGTKVHKATQEYDQSIALSWATGDYSKEEWILLARYADYCTFCNPDNILTEISLVSDALQYGGTLDRIVIINGIRILLDIKTSNYVYRQHWCQVAAYRELLLDQTGETVDAIGILHLRASTRKQSINPDGWQGKGWKLEIRNDSSQQLDIFRKVYDTWKYDNPDHTPGEKTYPAILQKFKLI